MILTESAPAKINLSLSVLGRRASDGYHLLDSIVAFADVGDKLRLDTDAPPGLTIAGPHAAGLAEQSNLVSRACEIARARFPGLAVGHVTLDKQLPVAAGIGGGSADAAAMVRLLRRVNPGVGTDDDWMQVALTLGADVPVCLAGSLTRVRGIGEHLEPCAWGEPLHAVLVNALTSVPGDKTATIFKALAAPFVEPGSEPVSARGNDREPVTMVSLGWLAPRANDLQNAARAVMPAVDDVLAALDALGQSALIRMSGAGPTCFALFRLRDDAERAASNLSRVHPTWWVRAATLN